MREFGPVSQIILRFHALTEDKHLVTVSLDIIEAFSIVNVTVVFFIINFFHFSYEATEEEFMYVVLLLPNE